MTQITEYSKTEAALADLNSRYAYVKFDVSTSKGLADAKTARAEIRGYRTALENLRKEIKAPALERCKLIDDEAKRITATLVSLEDPIDEQIKAEEARKEAERVAKEKAEKERIERIQNRVTKIANAPSLAIGKTSEQIAELIAQLSSVAVSESDFLEFADQASTAKSESLIALGKAYDERVAFEQAEKARIEAEALAKAEREAEEQRIAEARRKLAEEQALIDAQRREQEEREHAEREKLEAEEREAEALQQAERDRLAAEQRRIDDEKAEFARQKEREEFQRQAKEKAERDAREKFEREQAEQQERERIERERLARTEAARPDREKLASHIQSFLSDMPAMTTEDGVHMAKIVVASLTGALTEIKSFQAPQRHAA